jgi:SNF2 family DNA or RNA helicase
VDNIDNKAVVFRTRNPEKYKIIPKHKVIERDDGGFDVAVYWGLDEARVLKNLGVKDIQSPITRRYDWPGRYKPMAHQVETAAFLTMHKRAFCFNDPGTGKTLASLWAADYLMKLGFVRRVLILCPLSIMHSAWLSDLNNSIIHRSAIVAHHNKASRRIEMIQQDYEFVICNYDGLNLIADEIINDGRFDLVIVDEANAYKTVTTKRWKTLKSILTPKTHLWMMTGTPASQSPADAYGLAKLVNPDNVPMFFTGWRDSVMNKITLYKWAPKHDARDRVFNALQPAIRYSKDQCLDLPPVMTLTREVPLTPQQVKYYNMLKDQMLVLSLIHI